MRTIQKLNKSHLLQYQRIAYNSYPTIRDLSEEGEKAYLKSVEQIMEEDQDVVTFYGMFEGDEIVAVMRLFDFDMNLFGKMLPASGLGFLGVDLLHKKKGIAREMIQFYEQQYRDKGMPIASLLPFRPDFYKSMGYGFGTKMNQYRVRPEQIPKWSSQPQISRESCCVDEKRPTDRYGLCFVERSQLEEVWRCHDRVTAQTHGMIRKIPDEKRDLTEDTYVRIIGSRNEAGKLCGYMVIRFTSGKEGNYTVNEIHVQELVCENDQVLRCLLEFLRRQADQVRTVIFNTEHESFHYLFDNPLNDTDNYIPFGNIETNTQAIGMLYKVIDLKGAFAQCVHRDYNGVTATVRFLVEDPFTKIEEALHVVLRDGRLAGFDSVEGPVITARLKLCDFSSLFMGCVTAAHLHSLGLLVIDGGQGNRQALALLDRAFYCSQKPVSYTDF